MAGNNRGGFGWQEPSQFGGRQQSKTNAHDQAQAFNAFVREQILRGGPAMDRAAMDALLFGLGRTRTFYADAGDASPQPPTRKWPGALHDDDPIDMIEINGVWMCAADAKAALLQIEAR